MREIKRQIYQQKNCARNLKPPRTTDRADINRQKRRTKMPTLRKIKRGVLPTLLPTQKHHI
jgi:hypothetical protein